YLYVGSTPGTKNLVDSYETQTTSYLSSTIRPPLPSGVTLYATLWTKVGDVWRSRASTFTASPMSPAFIYPTDGRVGVDPTVPFRWTPPATTEANELRIGTSPGAGDLLATGTLTT